MRPQPSEPRDPYQGPVPQSAWEADTRARARGRVEMFNATRPGGLDGWTIALEQYRLVRASILETIDAFADADGSTPLALLVEEGQRKLGSNKEFPGGRLTNYIRFVKVDLEARCEVARIPGSSPQRVRRAAADTR